MFPSRVNTDADHQDPVSSIDAIAGDQPSDARGTNRAGNAMAHSRIELRPENDQSPADIRAATVNLEIESVRNGSSSAGMPSSQIASHVPRDPLQVSPAAISVVPANADEVLIGRILDRVDMNPEAPAPAKQMVRGLSAMLNHRGGVMTMRLDPPELGRVHIQMAAINGVVSARFEAESAQAHALLKDHLGLLRTSLENQGLTVERLTVSAPSLPASADSSGRGADHERSGQPGQHDAGRGESRGRRDSSGQHQENGSRQPFSREETLRRAGFQGFFEIPQLGANR